MTYLASRAALFALACALFSSVSACGSCNCPMGGGGVAQVAIPAAQSSPIVSVSETGSCGASAIDDHTVSVQATSAGGCRVLVQLANGDMYTFSVQFVAETIHGACDCGRFQLVGPAPTPTLTDAGIDAPI